MSALAVALLQFAAVRAAGQGGDKASEAAAAAISSTIQPLGPQYTVNVRPATTARVKDLSISGTNLVSTMDSNGRPYLCELPPSAAEGSLRPLDMVPAPCPPLPAVPSYREGPKGA